MNFKKLFSILFVATILLTSAGIAPKKSALLPADKIAALSNEINLAAANGKVTNAELMKIAATAKGEKLTLKEKIALKVFGKKISNKIMDNAGSAGNGGKSQVIALILVLLVGGIGIHRFYLGYTWQGIVQLLTLGGCGIWSLIDLIRIITGSLQPKDGEYEKTL